MFIKKGDRRSKVRNWKSLIFLKFESQLQWKFFCYYLISEISTSMEVLLMLLTDLSNLNFNGSSSNVIN